jgi:hypothetical protein
VIHLDNFSGGIFGKNLCRIAGLEIARLRCAVSARLSRGDIAQLIQEARAMTGHDWSEMSQVAYLVFLLADVAASPKI